MYTENLINLFDDLKSNTNLNSFNTQIGIENIAINKLTDNLVTLMQLYEKTNKFNTAFITNTEVKKLIDKNQQREDNSNYNIGKENKLQVTFITSNINKITELKSYLAFNIVGKFLNNFIEFNYLPKNLLFNSIEDEKTYSLVAKQKVEDFISSVESLDFLNEGSIYFAEDSGIELLCLKDQLGTRSKRFAFDNIPYIVQKFTDADNSQEYINSLVSDIRLMQYNSIFNNRIVIMKIKDLLQYDKDINDKAIFATGSYAGIISKDKIDEYKNTNVSIYADKLYSLGANQSYMYGFLAVNDILINTEEVVNCTFGFNNMIELQLQHRRVKYGKLPLHETICYNHRALSFSNTLTQMICSIFSNDLIQTTIRKERINN